MSRLHLIELEDLPWMPAWLRNRMTEYLASINEIAKPYRVIIPELSRALRETGARTIVDLCSGAGGPLQHLHQLLEETVNNKMHVVFTDKFPNAIAAQTINQHSRREYLSESIDARAVPAPLQGFRTMFTAFHHFAPTDARQILDNAAQSHTGIGIFEITRRDFMTFFMVLLTPLLVWLVTPFMRPFSFERLFWTYCIPLVPLLCLWDGFVSNLRSYSTKELHALAESVHATDYRWTIGEKRSRFGLKITYLLGLPA